MGRLADSSAYRACRVLPSIPAKLLQRAAETRNTLTDPLARLKAVEKAIEKVKKEYPEYFR